MSDDRGTIQVNCNIPEVRVTLDAVVTNYYTNAVIPGVPAGRHIITLEKPGFEIVGEEIQEVTLKPGDSLVLSFYLVPVGEEQASQGGHSDGDAQIGRK